MILLYDEDRQTVTAFQKAGEWSAANNADSQSRGPFPEGVFRFDRLAELFGLDGDTSGPYGRHFIAFRVPGRSGMAIHAGRDGMADKAGRRGFRHATMGCIRMATEGAAELWRMIRDDPVRVLVVDRGGGFKFPVCELSENESISRAGSIT